MTYGSTKTPLDYILEQGFRRIDEAVEGVIDRLAPEPFIDHLGFEWDCGPLDANRLYNYSIREMADRAATSHDNEGYELTP